MRGILETAYEPKRFQISDQRLPRGIRRIVAAVEDGNVYAAHVDIRDFYGGFTKETLHEVLPSPKGVVGNVVLGRRVHWRVCPRFTGEKSAPQGSVYHPVLPPIPHGKILAAARRGIPQDSCASSIVGLITCSMLHLPQWANRALFNHVDDFLVLAPTAMELENRVAELRGHCGSARRVFFQTP